MLMGADHLIALAVVASPDDPSAADEDDADKERDRGDEEEAARPRGRGVGVNEVEVGDPALRPVEVGRDRDPGRVRPLSSGSALRVASRSFALGASWGAGHSVGLAAVSAVFFATRRKMNLDQLGEVTDKLVGASMIALGVISLVSLRRWRARRALEREHVADPNSSGFGDLKLHASITNFDVATSLPPVGSSKSVAEAGVIFEASEAKRGSADEAEVCCLGGGGSHRPLPLVLKAGSDEHATAHDLNMPHVHVPQTPKRHVHRTRAELESAVMKEGAAAPRHVALHVDDVIISSEGIDTDTATRKSVMVGSETGDAQIPTEVCDGLTSTVATASTSNRSRWSLTIGTIHGVAGPSGILAVLPAIVLSNGSKATAYLVAFFIASTLSMASFAALFGLLARGVMFFGDARRGNREASEGSGDRDKDRDATSGRDRSSDRPARIATGLNMVAGVSAIAVGVLWLVLSGLGLLGDL